jgi:hypothetical protein
VHTKIEGLLDPIERKVMARTILTAGCPPKEESLEIDGKTYSVTLSNVSDGIELKLSRYIGPRQLMWEVYLIDGVHGTVSGQGTVRTWSGNVHVDTETFEQSSPFTDREYYAPASRADKCLQEWQRWV